MKHKIYLILSILILLVTPAFAQVDSTPDGIGI